MVYIETLGLDNAKSPIVEVGMVPFVNNTSGFSELDSPTHLHLLINAMKQEGRNADEAILKMYEQFGRDTNQYFYSGLNPYKACEEINKFLLPFLNEYGTVYFWSCGIDSNFPYLRNFYKQYGLKQYENMFPYYLCLDCRTLYKVAQERSSFVRKYATNCAHSALADCIWQIKELDRAYKAIIGYDNNK